MAGIIKVDRVQSDSNLAFNVAGANVAFMDASALRLVGSSIVANGSTIVSGSKVVTAAQPTGSVLQVVQAFKTNSFSTSSVSFVDITGLTVDITPTSSTSKIMVFATVAIGNGAGNAAVNLLRNGSNIAQSTSGTGNQTVCMDYVASYKIITYPIMYLDSPSTTSTQTYKLQMRSDGTNTAYCNIRANDNYYGSTSSITVMEIAA